MRAGFAVLVAACGHAASAPPAVTPASPAATGLEPVEMLCAQYGYEILIMESHKTYDGPELVTAVDAAQSAAQADVARADAAQAAGHPRDAALAYLACAKELAAVPDGDPMVGTAIYDARVCYDDAMWAFANAGRLAAEGKAALEAAAVADPRDAAHIREELAKDWSECAK
jgi:hypothetical protein